MKPERRPRGTFLAPNLRGAAQPPSDHQAGTSGSPGPGRVSTGVRKTPPNPAPGGQQGPGHGRQRGRQDGRTGTRGPTLAAQGHRTCLALRGSSSRESRADSTTNAPPLCPLATPKPAPVPVSVQDAPTLESHTSAVAGGNNGQCSHAHTRAGPCAGHPACTVPGSPHPAPHNHSTLRSGLPPSPPCPPRILGQRCRKRTALNAQVHRSASIRLRCASRPRRRRCGAPRRLKW